MMWSFVLFFIIGGLNPIPRVLFLTSTYDGMGTLPRGAHLALEEFSRHGAFVKFSDVSILYNEDELEKYDILIIPTSYGYHDVDRVLSFTYMDTLAMHNIVEWVKNGGMLIAGGNVGRNTLGGEDRVISQNILDRGEWPLGRAFGFDMIEVPIKNYSLINRWQNPPLLDWFSDTIWGPIDVEDWILVPTKEDKSVKHLAEWVYRNRTYGGITLNKYGKGYAIYLTTFLLLHPSFDGGWADIPEITRFYHQTFMFLTGLRKFAAGVNPWPAAKRAALAVTLDDGGVMEEYKRTLDALLSRVPEVTFFVTGKLKPEILNYLKKRKGVILGNHSYSHPFFRDLNYTDSKREILLAEEIIGKTKGFRFPYVNYTANGIFALNELGFDYETSIRVDHLNDFRGAIFPYNLVVAPQGVLITTELLELSPVQEDWAFYRRIYTKDYPESEQRKDQEAFLSYLNTMWSIIKDARGLMVQMGHPMYEGHSDAFLSPLLTFLDSVRVDKTVWLTSLEEVSQWWRAIQRVRVYVEEKKDGLKFEIVSPIDQLKKFTLWVDVPKDLGEPRLSVKNSGGFFVEREEENGRRIYILLSLNKGKTEVALTFKK